jgi:hypothetical protein
MLCPVQMQNRHTENDQTCNACIKHFKIVGYTDLVKRQARVAPSFSLSPPLSRSMLFVIMFDIVSVLQDSDSVNYCIMQTNGVFASWNTAGSKGNRLLQDAKSVWHESFINFCFVMN